MNTIEITRSLSHVKEFIGAFPRDSIPVVGQRPAYFVVNTDSNNEPGEHWVAMALLPEGKGEYFDSFGFPPLHEDIQNYIKGTCPNSFKYSNKTIQSPQSNFCGIYCIAFIISKNRNIKFRDYIANFTCDLKKNDHKVLELL